MRQKRKGRWKLMAACYLAALLVWLGWCGLLLGRDTLRLENGTLQRQELTPYDFTTRNGVGLYGDGTFISTDADAQLIYAPEQPFYATRFVYRGVPRNKGAGEMVLYYTTAPGQEFSERQKLWARQAPDGAWFFDLNGELVYRLRLDPDSMGGVFWQNNVFIVNERIPPVAYFIPDVQQAALLLLLPLLGWGVLSEVSAWVHPILARRRFEKRFTGS